MIFTIIVCQLHRGIEQRDDGENWDTQQGPSHDTLGRSRSPKHVFNPCTGHDLCLVTTYVLSWPLESHLGLGVFAVTSGAFFFLCVPHRGP